MAQLFYEPLARAFTQTGAVGAGFKYFFYTTGTTTPITTYSDSGLSVANANPVVADANGRFGAIWVSNLSTTKSILKDASDNVIETVDPVGTTSSTTSLNDLDVRPYSYWGLTSGTSIAYALTANPSISAYSNVQTFQLQPHIANGVAPTIAISGLGAINIKKYTGQGTKVALQVGDLQATERYDALCDGVDIMILNPRNQNTYYGTGQALTITVGVISITNSGSIYDLDTEGAAATDDLDTINGGNQGQLICLQTANSARDVVLKHNTGNIFNPGGVDLTLGLTTDRIFLMYDSTSAKWVTTSVNAAGSTPMQLLATKTASASATIDFSSFITSTFSKYVIHLINVLPATTATWLGIRYSVDGGGTYITASYEGNVGLLIETAGSFTNNGLTDRLALTADSSSSANRTVSNASTNGIDGEVTLTNPSSTTRFKSIKSSLVYDNNFGSFTQYITQGRYEGGTGAVNAIRFLFNSGNIASGTFELYGII